VFHSLPNDRTKGGGYRHIDAVLSDDKQRRQLLRAALDDMEHFKTKYAVLEELAGVFRAMDSVRRKVA